MELTNSQRRIIFVICLIISGIGLAGQLYVLIDYCLKGDVTFDSTFEQPTNVTIPDLMICTKLMSALTYDLVFKEIPKLYEVVCTPYDVKECLNRSDRLAILEREFLRTLTMDMAHKYVIKSHQLVREVIPAGYPSSRLNKKYCSILDHIMFPESCYTVRCRNGNETISVPRRGRDFSLHPSVITVVLNTTLLSSASFRILVSPTENSRATSEGARSVVKAKPGGSVYCQINYRKLEVYRLPPPFKTKCKNYTRNEALDQCLHRVFIKRFGSPCPGRFIHPNQYVGKRLKVKPLLTSGFEFIYQNCVKDLPEECKTVNYISQMQSEDVVEYADKAEVIIDVLVPTELDLIVHAGPACRSSQIVVLSSSVIGSWYGVSIFGILTSLMGCLAKICIRRRLRIKLNGNRGIRVDRRLFQPSLNFRNKNSNRADRFIGDQSSNSVY